MIIILIVALALLQAVTAFAATAPARPAVQQHRAEPAVVLPQGMLDISGTWQSDYGPVKLKNVQVMPDGRVQVKGTWQQNSELGSLSGFFDGTNLAFEGYQPWNQKYVSWNLSVVPELDGRQLNGKWDYKPATGSQSGWNMVRPPDYVASTAPVKTAPTATKDLPATSVKIGEVTSGSLPPPAGMLDISGTWQSDFGPVKLKIVQVMPDGQVKVKGTWQQGSGLGSLSGSFDGTNLAFEGYQPWNQKYVSWNLSVVPELDGRQLNGKWDYKPATGSQSGWNMVRPPDYVATKPPDTVQPTPGQVTDSPQSSADLSMQLNQYVLDVVPVEGATLSVSNDGITWTDVTTVQTPSPPIDLAALGGNNRYIRISLLPTTQITLDEAILFDFGKAALKSEAQAALQKVADRIKQLGGGRLIINGYTDNVGSDEYNFQLSKARAQAVKEYLAGTSLGNIPTAIRGWGKLRPIASNESPEGQKRNRRVEIIVLPVDASNSLNLLTH